MRRISCMPLPMTVYRDWAQPRRASSPRTTTRRHSLFRIVISGSSANAPGGIRLRPLAQRQIRIPPWLVLRTLGVLPHHEPVEEHVHGETLLESGTSRQQPEISPQELARQLWILLQIGGRLTREVHLTVAEEGFHQVEHAAHTPGFVRLLEDDVVLPVVVHYETWFEGLSKRVARRAEQVLYPARVCVRRPVGVASGERKPPPRLGGQPLRPALLQRDDGVRGEIVPSRTRPAKHMHKGEVLAHRPCHLESIVAGELLVSRDVRELRPWHARHDRVAPTEDVVARVEEIRPRDRRPGALVKHTGEEPLGRQLPVVVRSASQDVLSGRASDEHVLPEQSTGKGLGAHEFSEAESFQSRPELVVVDRPESSRVLPCHHNRSLRFPLAERELHQRLERQHRATHFLYSTDYLGHTSSFVLMKLGSRSTVHECFANVSPGG